MAVGTAYVGYQDIRIGDLNPTHGMSKAAKESGATVGEFFDSIKRSNHKQLWLQPIGMHKTQAFRKPESKDEWKAMLEEAPELKDSADEDTICYSTDGYIGTNGIHEGDRCDTCRRSLRGWCKRYTKLYVRHAVVESKADYPDFSDALPRCMNLGWACDDALTTMLAETELLGAPLYGRVYRVEAGLWKCRVGDAPYMFVCEASQEATAEDVADAELMLERYVASRIAKAVSQSAIPSVIEIAQAANLPALAPAKEA